MKITVLDPRGEKVGKIDLPKEIFEAEIREKLLAQAVRVFLFNQRQGTAAVKRRGEVRGSRKKIYSQKGTGRARHGDRYAPIFVGGGVAHGPRPRNWSLRLPRKMKRRALFSALTSKLQEGKILVVQDLEQIEPRTKKMLEILTNLKIKIEKGKLLEKTLLVLPQKNERVLRAGRNIANLQLCLANTLNTYQVLNCEKMVFCKPSIKVLKDTFLREK